MKKTITSIIILLLTQYSYAQQDSSSFKENLRFNVGFQFRSSMSINDSLAKTDFSLFVVQFGAEYDLLKKNKVFSLSPNINGKAGFFFFSTFGFKSGITFGLNDKLRTNFPIGLQFTMDYDINRNKYPGGNKEIYIGWTPEVSLVIKLSPVSLLKLSYGRTIIPNNNNNFIHNITIGVIGFNEL